MVSRSVAKMIKWESAISYRSLLLCSFIILVKSSTSSATYVCQTADAEEDERLISNHLNSSKNVIPLHYNLLLRVDLQLSNFTGKVSITTNLTQHSDYFVLHAKNLHIFETQISDGESGTDLQIRKDFMHEPKELYIIQLQNEVEPGIYDISISFSGYFDESSVGFYKTEFIDATGVAQYLATTKFQLNYARRMFPCFDELSFRASFKVTLVHETEYTALSNMPVETTKTIDDSFSETVFMVSPAMAPHSLGLLLGRLTYMEMTMENGVKLRVYATTNASQGSEYSLKMARKAIQVYENYFEEIYPLQKLDIVAVPTQKENIANWGLITVREECIQVEEDKSSLDEKSLSVQCLSSEIERMWFGNLVTIADWSEIWLLDAFAFYMSRKTIHAIETSLEKREFIADELYPIKDEDSFFFNGANNDVYEFYSTNGISQKKVAMFLKMLEAILEDDFQKGIVAFLKKYAYKSASADKLWSEMNSTQDFQVGNLMNHMWRNRNIYPIIDVKRDKGVTGRATLEQRYILSLPEYSLSSSMAYGFTEQPLFFRTSATEEEQLTKLGFFYKNLDLPEFEWIKFNVNFAGYYIINYSHEDWKFFIELLNKDHKVFSPNDRANFLYDAFILAKVELLPWSTFLNMTLYLRYETHIVPWMMARKLFWKIKSMQEKCDIGEPLEEHVKVLTKDLYSSDLWNNTGEYKDRELRRLLIDVSCGSGNYECLDTAASLWKVWTNGGKIREDVKCLVYTHGRGAWNNEEEEDEMTWYNMISMYTNETSYKKKIDLLECLASASDRNTIERLFRFFENETNAPTEHLRVLINFLDSNPSAGTILCSYILEHYEELNRRHRSNIRLLGQIIEVFFGSCKRELEFTRIEYFLGKMQKATEGLQIYAHEALKKINNSIMWIEKHGNKIKTWITSFHHMPWKIYRLPQNVIPIKYNIYMHPNISGDSFYGSINITANVLEFTDYLLIHDHLLTVSKIEIRNADANEVMEINEAFYYRENQFLVIRLDKGLHEGTYEIFLEFSGKFVEMHTGFTKRFYMDVRSGQSRPIVFTKLEPVYARRVFPCFDEPRLKSTFKITVVHNVDYMALSNMPEQSHTVREDGLIETQFMESLRMPTYLASVVVCDFNFTETEFSSGQRMRYFAEPFSLNNTLHGIDVIPKMLNKLEELLKASFSYPKLDFISIPQYTGGGMENWGLIYLMDLGFVWKDKTTSQQAIMGHDKTMAHELAHHWFGNLVTMEWWDDIWLNEGLSNWAAFKILKHFHPDSDELAVTGRKSVMMSDAYFARALIDNAGGNEMIIRMFDSITYIKGYAIALMLEHAMPHAFHKGLLSYIEKYSYGNARTEDLWSEITKAAENTNVSELMRPWSLQGGFPCVEIQINKNNFTARQRGFINKSLQSSKRKSRIGQIWNIPLTYRNINNGVEYIHWLKEEKATFPLNETEDACLYFNPGVIGYYMVKYDKQSYRILSKRLQHNLEDFPTVDRYNILYDSVVLAMHNLITYDDALELTKYLKYEKKLNPWQIFKSYVFHLCDRNLQKDGATYVLWKKYLLHLTDELYEASRGQNTENGDIIYSIACYVGNPNCISDYGEKLQTWLKGGSVELSLLENVIPWVNNVSFWEEMWTQFNDLNSTDGDEQYKVGYGLLLYNDDILLERTLNNFMTSEKLSSHTLSRLLHEIASIPSGFQLMWNYTKTQWDFLSSKLNSVDDFVVNSLCSGFSNVEGMQDVREFFRCHRDILLPIHEKQCLSEIRKNILWFKQNGEIITNWLKMNVPRGIS